MNCLSVLCNSNVFLFGRTGQPVRFRYVPDPGTLEQRLFKAVTKPVIPPIDIDPVKKRIRVMEEKRLHENNPYRKFLVGKAEEEFFKLMDNNMVLVFQELFYRRREIAPVKNQLFLKGMKFKGFPLSILREAAKGTRYELFTRYFLHSNIPNTYLFAEPTPENCRDVIKMTKKVHFLLLIGGFVHNRIMTVQQLNDFASLSAEGLDGVRSQLVTLLEHSRGGRIVTDLNYHQSFIVRGLKNLSNAGLDSDESNPSEL
ncbi:unnamed protein product [Heterobilharzia americana]|nr:unnamed protein product [Heterobilharzia americana]